jgi:hypothetical protein
MAAKKQISRIQHRRGLQVDLSGVILNSGELGFSVDERRLFIGNRTAEDAPTDENVEILTQYASIPATQIVKDLDTASFTTLSSDTTFLTYDSNTVDVLLFTYKLTQGAIKRTGTFRIISDGSSVSYDDDFIEVGGTSSVTLKAVMSGADIQVQYNVTTTVATFDYFVEQL